MMTVFYKAAKSLALLGGLFIGMYVIAFAILLLALATLSLVL